MSGEFRQFRVPSLLLLAAVFWGCENDKPIVAPDSSSRADTSVWEPETSARMDTSEWEPETSSLSPVGGQRRTR
jgi:hypothetical protein